MNGGTILDIVGLVAIANLGAALTTTAKAYGRGLLPGMGRMMVDVTLQSSKAFVLAIGLVLLTNYLYPHLLESWIPPIPALLQIGMMLTACQIACLPPSILFLSASAQPGLGFLVSATSAGTFPLRVVHLLESSAVPPWSFVSYDKFRVDMDWNMAVKTLMKIAPLIIVDGRIPTVHVATEIREIMSAGLDSKTFIITDDRGFIPAFTGLALPETFDPYVATPDMFAHALDGLGFRFLLARQQNLAAHFESRISQFRRKLMSP